MPRLLRSWLLLAALPAPPQAAGQAAGSGDPLLGIWVSESLHRPGLVGELVLRRSRAGWVATLGGAEVRAEAKGDSVRLAFETIGRFRGRLADGGRSVAGAPVRLTHWSSQ